MNKDHDVCTTDGAIDSHGHLVVRERTGTWVTGILILGISVNSYIYIYSSEFLSNFWFVTEPFKI